MFFVLETILQSCVSCPPNFIILFADDMGYGDLECYGHPTIRTPNLDQMAAEGLRLTSFYVASSVCSPSRAALLTGKYPSNVGVNVVFNNKSKTGLQPSEHTIAEGLKDAGYATAIIGKWHLGNLPEFLPMNQGFDYWYGIPYSNDNNGTSAPGNDYLDGPPLPMYENESLIEQGVSMEIITQRYTVKAIEFIKKKKDRPFFLYLSYTMPHVPIDASANFKGISAAGLYGDVIEELDWSAGQILKSLEELGLTENTMVVFTSDNGPMIHMDIPSYDPDIIKPWHHGTAGPLRGGKFDVYEGGFRVPAIILWKGKIEGGSVSADMARSIDLYPTLLQLAGASTDMDQDIDGLDLSDFFFGRQASPVTEMIYERGGRIKALRKGDWKIVRTGSGNDTEGIELYNLKRDISERYNVADQYPEIAEDLVKHLE
jgi:arylsulfatase A-like enzyme